MRSEFLRNNFRLYDLKPSITLASIIAEIVFKNDEIVILLYEISQIEMSCKKWYQLIWGPVVGKLSWFNTLLFQHALEKLFAVATPLHWFVDIEI